VLAVGDALVGLLDAPEDLLVELVAERLERPGRGLGVAVLGLEVAGHRGIVLVAQPVVVVDAAVAELRHDLGLFLRHGRRQVLGSPGGEGSGEGKQHGEGEEPQENH
jgi:hypothetical protein